MSFACSCSNFNLPAKCLEINRLYNAAGGNYLWCFSKFMYNLEQSQWNCVFVCATIFLWHLNEFVSWLLCFLRICKVRIWFKGLRNLKLCHKSLELSILSTDVQTYLYKSWCIIRPPYRKLKKVYLIGVQSIEIFPNQVLAQQRCSFTRVVVY